MAFVVDRLLMSNKLLVIDSTFPQMMSALRIRMCTRLKMNVVLPQLRFHEEVGDSMNLITRLVNRMPHAHISNFLALSRPFGASRAQQKVPWHVLTAQNFYHVLDDLDSPNSDNLSKSNGYNSESLEGGEKTPWDCSYERQGEQLIRRGC